MGDLYTFIHCKNLFSDDVLNKAIQAMRNQREQDMRSKDSLAQDKARLEALVNQLQGRVADLEGQVSSLNGSSLC